jgi:hypothetical protein
MKRYYTFGFDHVDPDTKERLHNKYVTVDGIDENNADGGRSFMFAIFGKKWSMEYGGELFKQVILDKGYCAGGEHAYYNLEQIRGTGRDVATEEHMDRDCVCNVGVVECSFHPKRLLTKEQKIDFRKDWDAKVSLDEAQKRGEI